MTTTEEVIHTDDVAQNLVRLYAVLNDWQANIAYEKRGHRARERIVNIREEGVIPLAQRYFEYLAATHDQTFEGDAHSLLERWEDDFRPDYVAESDGHDWDEHSRQLRRALLDVESRLGRFAVDTSVAVNKHTVVRGTDNGVPDDVRAEFRELWTEWHKRLDDLYWQRRRRLSHQIVQQIERGHVETEDKTWERRRDRYPEFPPRTVIGGSEVGY